MKINNKLLLTKIAPVTLAAVAVAAAVAPDGRNGHSHLSFDTGRLTPSSEHSGLHPHEYTLGEEAGERPRDFEGVLEDIGVDAKAGYESGRTSSALKQDEGTRLYNNYKNLGHSVAALRSFWALGDLLWTPIKEVDVSGLFAKGALRVKEQKEGGLPKEALNTKQPSALTDEGGLPKDEAHDEAARTTEIVQNSKSGSTVVTPKTQSRVLSQELDANESRMDEQGSTLGDKAEDAVEGRVQDDGGGGADVTVSSTLRHAGDGVQSFVAAMLIIALLALLVPERDVLVSYRNAPRVVSHKKLFSFRTTAILCCALASATVSLAGDATAPLLYNRPAVSQDLGPHMHLRGRSEHLDLSDRDKEVVLSAFAQDVMDLISEMELIADQERGNNPYVLKASADLLSLLNDRLSNPQLIPSLPHQFKPLFKTIVEEVSTASAQLMTVQKLVSDYSSEDVPGVSKHRQLASGRKLSASPRSRLSQGDYYSHAKSSRWQNPHHLGFASLAGDQQGYFRARAPRQEGTHRRLSQDDGISCIRDDPDQRKTDQCFRLASCARNYNIYDLFVFMFGDDTDFETGLVDDKERIEAHDEAALIPKLYDIWDLSEEIYGNYNKTSGELNDKAILDSGGLCDQLLQQFHRFDEDLSVRGKWQGGSVTAVCRGWGTNRFMSLEAIYHISDAVMGVKERVENCLELLVDRFNGELEDFNITEDGEPCDDVLRDPDGRDAQFYKGYGGTKADYIADIKKKFGCLKYSYLVKYGNITDDGDCPDNDCDPDACKEMKHNPVFSTKDDDKAGDGWKKGVDHPFFDYKIPAVLPPLAERLSEENIGQFLLDAAPREDYTSERFIIEVFSQYMGCAHYLVKKLEEKAEEKPEGSVSPNIFANGIRNPYSPTSEKQFSLPMKISETATDKHGQINVTYLDDVFDYLKIGHPWEDQEIDVTADPPKFSTNLTDYLAWGYFSDAWIDSALASCEARANDDDDKNDCKEDFVEKLEQRRKDFFKWGLDRSSLDTSIALIFGNKTTIGQVCSYAKGLEDGTVDDVPGFCCLDAPYESQDWGEKFACTKYVNLTDGSTKVVPKNATDCNRLGPVTTAFNEAACDILHGTWCPTPRSCQELVNCVRDTKEEVLKSRTRPAFYEYLNAAPLVEDANDPVKCGELREYFEYDADFPDDDRLCEEVRNLQCHTDFTNLDAFASGTAGQNGEGSFGLAELAVDDTLVKISSKPFPFPVAYAWRNANFVLAKIVESLKFLLEQIYAEVVDAQDGNYEGDRQNSMYTNIITNHGNIIQTFYATQQLKVMMGEISDGIADLEEGLEDGGGERRLQTSDCVNVTEVGWQIGCTNVTCEDPARLCDSSFNFPYIALLKGAGCDDLDSDGDGEYDVCEDRYPPETVVRDAEIFRCDEDDTSRLCYGQHVFKNETHLMNFLEYHFPVTDDCQPTRKLSAIIEYVGGECRDALYKITPMQNVSACEGRPPVKPGELSEIVYVNPLNGTAKEVAVAFDSEAPVVQCGFREPGTASIDKLSGNKKTLYHYMLKTEGSGNKLNDARFFFNVTDNCNDDVQIDIGVKSNELQQDTLAELFKYDADPVEQVAFLYAPTTCGNIVEAKLCRENPSNVRSYEIGVAATDSAGNIGRDTCKVVIVSPCSPPSDGCEKLQSSGDPTAETFYYTIPYVESASSEPDQVFYKVASTEFVWERA